MSRGVKQLVAAATTTSTGTPFAFSTAPPAYVRKVMASIAGTGTVSATIIVDASMDGVDIYAPAFTIALSGTNSDNYIGWLNACNGNQYRARVTAISGTGATVNVWMEE